MRKKRKATSSKTKRKRVQQPPRPVYPQERIYAKWLDKETREQLEAQTQDEKVKQDTLAFQKLPIVRRLSDEELGLAAPKEALPAPAPDKRRGPGRPSATSNRVMEYIKAHHEILSRLRTRADRDKAIAEISQSEHLDSIFGLTPIAKEVSFGLNHSLQKA